MNFAVDPAAGWLAGTGPLIRFDQSEIMNRGPDILLENLEGFHSRPYERMEFATLPMAEKRKFERAHDNVGVTLLPNGQLEIQPMVPASGRIGSKGDKMDAVKLVLPANATQFWDSLLLALARCRP